MCVSWVNVTSPTDEGKLITEGIARVSDLQGKLAAGRRMINHTAAIYLNITTPFGYSTKSRAAGSSRYLSAEKGVGKRFHKSIVLLLRFRLLAAFARRRVSAAFLVDSFCNFSVFVYFLPIPEIG